MEDPIKSVSWQNGQIVCRCCLAEGCYKDIGNEYFWMGKREVYEEMLSATFDIKISYGSSGGLTRPICEACISRLRDASEFKRQVLECEKMFIQQLAPGTSSTVDIQISPERTLKEVKIEGIVKVEKLEDSDDDGDGDVVFEDLPGADDDDDDMDDEPLMKFATKEPKKEKDLLKLLSGAGTSVVKRKSTTISTKASPSKRAKTEKPAPSSTKKMITIKRNPAPKAPPPKKKKEPEKKKVYPRMSAMWNATILMRYATVYPIHVRNETLTCVYCATPFEVASDFRAHMDQEHAKFDKTKALKHRGLYVKLDCSDIRCKICNNEFSTLDEVAKHLKESHRAKLNLDKAVLEAWPYKFEDRRMKCGICFSTSTGFNTLSRHFASHFPNLTCSICGKTFIGMGTYKQHILSCNNKGKFFCIKCMVPFSTSEERLKHQEETYYCRRYSCTKCDQRFISNITKQKHMLEVHGVKPKVYPCTECKKMFSFSYELRHHVQSNHSQLCKYVCQHCSKGFDYKGNLNDHLTIHTGEKTHQCTDCEKAFATKKNLVQHSWIHKDVKRFECESCDRKFNQRVSWRTHMRKLHPELGIK